MSSITASKILIFGGTGTIGRYITTALLRAKPAFQQLVLFTSPNSAKEKVQQLEKWKSEGLSVIVGDLTSEADVTAAYDGIDTVISAVGRGGLEHQLNLLRLAEASESVKWFLPSEFGTDIEHNVRDLEPPQVLADVLADLQFELMRTLRLVSRWLAGLFPLKSRHM